MTPTILKILNKPLGLLNLASCKPFSPEGGASRKPFIQDSQDPLSVSGFLS